jgi:predicted RNase H-like HicB family nuclease
MVDMNSYDVNVTREKGAWLAAVPSVPGASTFARSLPGLLESIRQVIVLMEDLDDDAGPEVVLHFDVDEPIVRQAEGLAAARRNIAVQERELQAATADAARRLTKAGYSVRDAAVMLHITPGRISQLTNA